MQHPSKPLAKTRQGTLAGSAEQGIHIWRGIPYAFNGDALPGGISGSEDRAKIFLKNMKACGVRRQADMNIGSRRLRGGFRQILFHRAAP